MTPTKSGQGEGDFGLGGKVAVVTASSSGIGLGAARRLAMRGCAVVINGRDPARLSRAEAEIADLGADVSAVEGDLAREPVRAALLSSARDLGGLDVLVTNTGGPVLGRFTDLDAKAWDDTYRSLYFPVIDLIRDGVGEMKRRSGGSIVLVTTIMAREPDEGMSFSSSMRSGWGALAKVLSRELGPHGIRVNQVMPGTFRTSRFREYAADLAERSGISEQEMVERLAAGVPLRRIGNVEEIGDVIAFLASDLASYVTGAGIQVDGGAQRSV